MLTRLGLVATTLICSAIAFAATADAGKLKFKYYTYDPDYDFYYGPEYIPQPRYYRYFQRDRPGYLYDNRDYEDDYAYDPDYYEPEYVPPRKRRAYAPQIQEQPPKLQKQQKPQAAKKKPTTITCAKAGEIVSGYGFKSVQQVTCKGQVYAFNATRDGKPFSVKLNSSSGELTEVKKR